MDILVRCVNKRNIFLGKVQKKPMWFQVFTNHGLCVFFFQLTTLWFFVFGKSRKTCQRRQGLLMWQNKCDLSHKKSFSSCQLREISFNTLI